ncbi:hypothetical protein HKX48_004130 [Thoreauomyces humboldtii]|nr:hypothetical protein HKX48_004130 [Thoreauomyces humboldtii]
MARYVISSANIRSTATPVATQGFQPDSSTDGTRPATTDQDPATMMMAKPQSPLPPVPSPQSHPGPSGRLSSPRRLFQDKDHHPRAGASPTDLDELEETDDRRSGDGTMSLGDTTSFMAAASLIPPGKSQSYTAIFEDALDQLGVLADICGITEGGATTGSGATGGGGGGGAGGSGATTFGKGQGQSGRPGPKLRSQPLDALSAGGKPNGSSAIATVSNAHSARNQLKIQQERSTLQGLIGRTARELREYRFNSLVSTVEEEYRKRNTLQETIDREREASQTLRSLQKELQSEKRLLEDETHDRNQVIQQLKDTIQEINVLTTSEQKYIKKETKAHESSVRQRCTHDETVITESRSVLVRRIEQEGKAHDKIVDFLTRQREMMERQIQEWMGKYEEDTEAKVGELEAFKQKRSSDLDRFEELLAAYEELEKVVEEDRTRKQVEADRIRGEKLEAQAATRIQRWYKRKLEARKELARQAKSAKGKKGTKKGGKAAAAGTAPTTAKAKTPATPKKK